MAVVGLERTKTPKVALGKMGWFVDDTGLPKARRGLALELLCSLRLQVCEYTDHASTWALAHGHLRATNMYTHAHSSTCKQDRPGMLPVLVSETIHS